MRDAVGQLDEGDHRLGCHNQYTAGAHHAVQDERQCGGAHGVGVSGAEQEEHSVDGGNGGYCSHIDVC